MLAPLLFALLAAGPADAGSSDAWPRFRGPDGSAVAPDADRPPHLGRHDGREHPLEHAQLPGPGASSPVVWGDAVFVTYYTGYGTGDGFDTEPTSDGPGDLVRHLVRLDRDTGDVVWTKDIPATAEEDPYRGFISEHGYATSTPLHRRRAGLLLLRQDRGGRVRLRRQRTLAAGVGHRERPPRVGVRRQPGPRRGRDRRRAPGPADRQRLRGSPGPRRPRPGDRRGGLAGRREEPRTELDHPGRPRLPDRFRLPEPAGTAVPDPGRVVGPGPGGRRPAVVRGGPRRRVGLHQPGERRIGGVRRRRPAGRRGRGGPRDRDRRGRRPGVRRQVDHPRGHLRPQPAAAFGRRGAAAVLGRR